MTEEALNEAVEAAEPVEAPAERSTRDSVRDALERVNQDRPAFEREAPEAPKPEVEEPAEVEDAKGRERGPDGKFKAKDGGEKTAEPAEKTPLDDDPPARFSPDAKQAWKEAPPAIKAEIRRALTENEKGLKDYQDRWEPLKRFDDMARQSGTTIHEAMERYVGLENMMRQDPLRGLDAVARNVGLSLEQVARHVLKEQQPEGQADPRDNQIAQLEQMVHKLTQQVGGVTQNMQNQQMLTVQQQIDAAKSEMPRFDELESAMARLIQAGIAEGPDQGSLLMDAYRKADGMSPAAAPAFQPAPQPALQTEAPAARAQTPQPLSVQGAPASGSNPGNRRQPSPNARSSVKRALAQVMRV